MKFQRSTIMGATLLATGVLGATMAVAQTEVRWLHIEQNPAYLSVWEDIAASFNAQNPDVNVTMQFLENEAFKARLPTLLQSSSAPHMFYSWGGGVLRAQAENGVLMNLNEAMAEQRDGQPWGDSFNPAAVDGLSFDGETWAVPFRMGTVSFFYNKELFEQAGIDSADLTDWSAFLNAIETLKEAGLTPIAVGGGERWPVHFYWSYLAMRIGGQEVVDNAKIGAGEGFGHEAFVSAGEELRRLGELDPFQPGYLGATWPQTLGAFGDGNAAMILSFENTVGTQRNNSADGVGLDPDNIGRFPFPMVEGGNSQITDTLGGLNGWAVSVNAPPETLDFLAYFTNQENQRKMAAAEMLIPVTTGAEDAIEGVHLRDAADQLAASTWHQNYFDQDFGPSLGRVINDISVELVTGNMSPSEAVSMLQNEFALQ
ncbi:MAG: extracellular solute-binding protein [Loktanella sp.]|nr:extracellular solute-binding protein [Loktanella sp.]